MDLLTTDADDGYRRVAATGDSAPADRAADGVGRIE
jgi:hypothetical protein